MKNKELIAKLSDVIMFFDDWERFVYVSSSYYQILKDFTKEKGSIMSVMLALKCMGYKIEYR